MHRSLRFFAFFFLMVGCVFPLSIWAQLNFYTAGQAQIELGHTAQGVSIWRNGLHQLNEMGQQHPAMAFSFIETVAANGISSLYTEAAYFYVHSFLASGKEESHEALLLEIERLGILAGHDAEKAWKMMLTQPDSSLFLSVSRFWNRMNPVSITSYNERLLEHWKRVAYARSHFTRMKNPPLFTDDRGTFYVRFGPPDFTTKRHIHINEVRDPATELSIRLMSNLAFEVESWTYYFNGQAAMYFFGTSGTGGTFGLQPSLMSMIPVAGNRISGSLNSRTYQSAQTERSIRVKDGQTEPEQPLQQASFISSRGGAEFLLKYTVLEQLAGDHEYFHQIYSDMLYDVTTSQNNFERDVALLNTKYQLKEQQIQLKRDQTSPNERTNYWEDRVRIPLHPLQYELFTPSGSPRFIIVLLPDFSPLSERLSSLGASTASLLRQTYFIKNDLTATPRSHIVSSSAADGSGFFHPSYFGYEPVANEFPSVEVHVFDPNRALIPGIRDTLDHMLIASSGSIPLELNPKEHPYPNFQVSDVILGVPQNILPDAPIPILPSTDHTFAKDSALQVYLEVFQTQINPYTITYSYETIGLTGRTSPLRDIPAITLRIQPDAPRDVQFFSIEAQQLKKGTYRITFTITSDSKREIKRTLPITIKD